MARHVWRLALQGWTAGAGPPYVGRMHVSCPNCSAAYDVPDHLLAAGPRLMQCARCGHQFSAGVEHAAAPAAPMPVAEPPSPAAQPSVEAAPRPTAAPAAPPQGALSAPQKRDRLAILGWVATLCLLALGAGLVVTNHPRITEAWAPAERLFTWLGLG